VGGWPIPADWPDLLLAGTGRYSGGPWPFGYHGLGDLVCFICFGVLACWAPRICIWLEITPLDVWAIHLGWLLVTAILIVNNLRDIDSDRQTGKMTLAVYLGRRGTGWSTAPAWRSPYVACCARPEWHGRTMVVAAALSLARSACGLVRLA